MSRDDANVITSYDYGNLIADEALMNEFREFEDE